MLELQHWRNICTILQSMGGPIPEEMSQTLLTNKKEGNLVHAAIIINANSH